MKCKKIPYSTRREALSITKIHGEARTGKVYRCPFCRWWHLGNKIPKKSDIGKIAQIGRLRRRGEKQLMRLIDKICGVI